MTGNFSSHVTLPNLLYGLASGQNRSLVELIQHDQKMCQSSLNLYSKLELTFDEVGLPRQVCLVSDPRPSNPTGKTYTVDCLGNIVGGQRTVYNNQPIELLAQLAKESIKAGSPVWFGCDVSINLKSSRTFIDPRSEKNILELFI